MTTRRRLARLERLERLQPSPSCPEFIIAPERAQAIIAAYGCLEELLAAIFGVASRTPRNTSGCPTRQRRRRPPRAWPNCCGTSVAPRTTGPNRPTRIEGISNLITRTGVRSRVMKPFNYERA
jgi:hypothetical protein